MLDLNRWLNSSHVPIAEITHCDNSVTFTLAACPWNSAHGQSAYIIQNKKTGKIAATCSHAECKNKDWAALKKLYTKEDNSLSAPDVMADFIEENITLFKTQFGEAYMLIELDGCKRPVKIESKDFLQWVRLTYRNLCGKTISKENLVRVQETISALAMSCTDVRKTNIRAIEHDGTIFYDLMGDNAAVKISLSRVEFVNSNDYPIIFERTAEMLPQIIPDLGTNPQELLSLLGELFRVSDSQRVLFAVYLISAFEPDLVHPLLMIQGEKGSAKSTSLSMLSKLINPCINELSPLPSILDLPTAISNTYFCCFDNLRKITQETSDLLCVAVSGGWIKRRKLYSDNDMVTYNLKRMIALNGIDIAGAPSDLLDRSIIINCSRISPNERLTQEQITNKYMQLAPKILGGCFNTLAKALALLPSTTLSSLPRMADFARLGWCVAEAMQEGLGTTFISQYEANQLLAAEESVTSSIFVDTLVEFMHSTASYTDSVRGLYRTLKEYAQGIGINTSISEFPQAPNYFSRRLSEYKLDLNRLGIEFFIKNIGSNKSITIINTNIN